MKLLFALAALSFLPGLPAVPPAPAARLPRPAFAAPLPDSTTVRLLYGSENPELNELMGRVLGVEKHRLLLSDRRLAGRRLHLTLQEYRRGVAGPEKELTANASLTQLDSAGRFQFTIYARQVSENKVENRFILPRAGMPRAFTTEPGQAANYSLRFDIRPYRRSPDQTGGTALSPVQEFRLPVGPPTVLAVYTLPYETQGMLLYCGLAQSRVPVADWYARFKVQHYVVYRVRVE